jgi:hypothetical protein
MTGFSEGIVGCSSKFTQFTGETLEKSFSFVAFLTDFYD